MALVRGRGQLAALGLALATAGALPARAAPAAEDPGRKQAHQLLEEGNALYDKGDFPGALKKFQAAYAIYPSPKILFNVAQVLAALGNNADAADGYKRFLDGVQADPVMSRSEYAEKARKRLAQLEVTVGRLELHVTPATATIAVDGRAAHPGTVYVPGGAHQVVVSAPGMETDTQLVAVSASQRVQVEVTLQPARMTSGEALAAPPEKPVAEQPAPAVSPAASAPASTTTTQVAPRGEPSHRPALIAFGVAGALGLGAAVMSGITYRQYQSLPAQAGPAPAQFTGDYASELRNARIADGLWVATLAAAGVGGYLWFSAAPAPDGSGGEISVGGRF